MLTMHEPGNEVVSLNLALTHMGACVHLSAHVCSCTQQYLYNTIYRHQSMAYTQRLECFKFLAVIIQFSDCMAS